MNTDFHVFGSFGLAIDGHRPNKVVVLTIDINKPKIVQGFLCCQSFLPSPQETRHKNSSLATKPGFYFWGERESSFHDVGDGVRVVLAFEGSDPCHEFVDGDAESPHVYLFVVASPLEHFWGSVVGSASKSEHISFDSPFDEFFADAKINQFDALLVEVVEDVFRFDVPVADLVGVQVGQGFYYLIDDFFEFLSRGNLTASVLMGTVNRSGKGRKSMTRWYFSCPSSKKMAL